MFKKKKNKTKKRSTTRCDGGVFFFFFWLMYFDYLNNDCKLFQKPITEKDHKFSFYNNNVKWYIKVEK